MLTQHWYIVQVFGWGVSQLISEGNGFDDLPLVTTRNAFQVATPEIKQEDKLDIILHKLYTVYLYMIYNN